MLKRFVSGAVAVALATTFGAFVGVSAGSAATVSSGQVMNGNTSFSTATGHFTGGGNTVEPAINDANGATVYLLTPTNAKVHPNAHNVAPLYLPVYPAGSGIDPASLNCAHVPADNCPDHGPGVAGAAMSIVPSVYGGGVVGHDHLVGVASTGGDFNIIWEPVLVLFTSADAATQRITTLAQIETAKKAGQIQEVPLPQLDFHCAIVGAAVYDHGTPAPTVTGP
jgi:hypothetical protein